jgi:hypothetical protein
MKFYHKVIFTLLLIVNFNSSKRSRECNLNKLPVDDYTKEIAQANSFIESIQKGLFRQLTPIENFMFTRGLIMTLYNAKFCEQSKINCKAEKSQDKLIWENEFWEIMGWKGCEAENDFSARIAIDYPMGQIQIGVRETNKEYTRFGVDLCNCQVIIQNGLGYTKNSHAEKHVEGFEYLKDEEKKTEQMPGQLTSVLVEKLHKNGGLIVATLGFARESDLSKGEKYKDKVKEEIQNLESRLKKKNSKSSSKIMGIMTGGYKGVIDKVYGITRIGHDIAHELKLYSLVVTPQAGKADTHETPDSRSLVGRLWGDDSKALVSGLDAALFFYRSSKGENQYSMGRWTEIEAAHCEAQGVPHEFIDIDDLKLHDFSENFINSIQLRETTESVHLNNLTNKNKEKVKFTKGQWLGKRKIK